MRSRGCGHFGFHRFSIDLLSHSPFLTRMVPNGIEMWDIVLCLAFVGLLYDFHDERPGRRRRRGHFFLDFYSFCNMSFKNNGLEYFSRP